MNALLDSVPKPEDWTQLSAWLESTRRTLFSATRDDFDLASLSPLADLPTPSGPFGRYPDPRWRKWVAATYVADLACYPHPSDQVTFERLAFAMHVFPQGFRTWWVRHLTLGWLPVGYTAWHPIPEATFAQFVAPGAFDRHAIVPVPVPAPPQASWIYLFNYSVVAPLRRSQISRSILTTLAGELAAARAAGLAAVVVSEDGARVARRFGLRQTGSVMTGGKAHVLYCSGAGPRGADDERSTQGP